jgi:type IV pilus assembly protein PilB
MSASLTTEVERMRREGVCPIHWFARLGHYDEQKALAAVSQRLSLPLKSLEDFPNTQITSVIADPKFNAIEQSHWEQIAAVPLAIEGRKVTIAFANPIDLPLLSHIKALTSLNVEPVLAAESEILHLLGAQQTASSDKDLASLVFKQSEGYTLPPLSSDHDATETNSFEATLTSSDLSAPPVIKLVNKIIADAIQHRASDVHITPEREALVIQVRIDGIMHPLFTVPARVQSAVVSRIKLLSGLDISERRRPQDGRMRVKSATGIRDLRVATSPTAFGERVVLRILSSDITSLKFSALGFDDETKARLEPALKSSSRVILVTGPTGSGKTSTLYGILSYLHDGTNSIVTVEDPIEYKIEGINQIQVNAKIGMTFAEGLRSILRQDPDIIMVGEIRDLETAEIAMQAAQTGHLVLSTLHTNSAASAVTRLVDLGLPPPTIAASVGTIIAQRLARRLCQVCAEKGTSFSQTLLTRFGLAESEVWQAKGCTECDGTGYHGRVGLFSLLEVSDEVRERIRGGAGESQIEQAATTNGYRSLLEAGLELVRKGITSLDEIERTLGSLELLHLPHEEQLQERQTPATGGLQKRTILLVEDDENTRSVLSLLLRREMFEVVEAEDGLDALEKVFIHPPTLILCDIMMPRMGGLEFLQRLRKDKRVRDIPVLMLTAADGEENELSSLNSGADDFVSKASDSRVMLARVHRLLERAE